MRQNSEYEKQLLDEIWKLEKENKTLTAGVKNGHDFYLNVDEWEKEPDVKLDKKLEDLFVAVALVRSKAE